MVSLMNTECMVVMGVTGLHSNLTSIRFCLANLLKVIPPPTLSVGLAFFRVLRITTKMATQTTSITSFVFILGFPSCVDIHIVTTLIDSVSSPFTESTACCVSNFLHWAATSKVRFKFRPWPSSSNLRLMQVEVHLFKTVSLIWL